MISIDAAGLSYDECLALGFPKEVVDGAIWTLNMAIGKGLGALTVTRVSEILLESGNQNATNERFVQMVNYLVRIKLSAKDIELADAFRSVSGRKNQLSGGTAVRVLASHYRYMYKHFGLCGDKVGDLAERISNSQLPKSNVTVLSAKAIVDKIPADSKFCIYNSSRYLGAERYYDVLRVGRADSDLASTRKPVLTKEEVQGRGNVIYVAEGIGKLMTGKMTRQESDGTLRDAEIQYIRIDNRFVRLLSRYVIVASTRKPSNQCGMNAVMGAGGSVIYVYAVSKNNFESNRVNLRDGSLRVYAYGFTPKRLRTDLASVTNYIYRECSGARVVSFTPDYDFNVEFLPVVTQAQSAESELLVQFDSKY